MNSRLDYQPLFGKMSPHSKDRTRETAEIEPNEQGFSYIMVLLLNLLIAYPCLLVLVENCQNRSLGVSQTKKAK